MEVKGLRRYRARGVGQSRGECEDSLKRIQRGREREREDQLLYIEVVRVISLN